MKPRHHPRSVVQIAMSVLEHDSRPTGPERRAMVARGVCPDCRRPLVGTRIDRASIRVTCSRACGYTRVCSVSRGLARALGMEPLG